MNANTKGMTMGAMIQISYENETTSAIGVVGNVRLGNDQFNAYRTAVKSGRGARFSGAPRYVWLVPHESIGKVVQGLQSSGFSVAMDDNVRTKLVDSIETSKVEAEAREAAATSDAMVALARVRESLSRQGMTLFDHQSFGIRWLASIERGLLADEMGLGKTLQAVASIRTCGVIIAPSVAKGVWVQEINRFRPDLRVTMLKGRGSFRWPERGEVVITNYEILPAPPEGAKKDALLVYKSPTVNAAPEGCDLIADEAHKLVSNKSATTLSFRMLSACVRKAHGRVIGITATPMAKHPPQLWSILTSLGIAKTAFDDYATFERLFGYSRNYFGGGDWLGPRSENDKAEIASRLARVMLRRLRSEAITLPPRTFTTKLVEVSASAARECERLVARLSKDGADPMKAIETALQDRTSPAFSDIAQVRSILAAAKLDAMLEEVEAYEQAEEPLMVLSAHKAPIEALRGRPGWVVISGEENAEQKTAIAARFQTDTSLKGVAVSIAAGGVAITLHRAAHCLMVDQAYNPSANSQATDRIYRIGQKRSVFVKILVADHPIDRRVTELLQEKTELFESTIEQVERCTLHDECLEHPEQAKRCARERAIASRVEARLTEIEKSVPVVDFDTLLSGVQAEAMVEKVREEKAKEKAKEKHESKRGRYVEDSSAELRSAENEIEEWAAAGLTMLNAACDGVHKKDDVGFSVATRPVGAWLAQELMVTDGRLTPKGWAAAVRVCLHHRHQLGGNPSK